MRIKNLEYVYMKASSDNTGVEFIPEWKSWEMQNIGIEYKNNSVRLD